MSLDLTGRCVGVVFFLNGSLITYIEYTFNTKVLPLYYVTFNDKYDYSY